MGTIYEANQDSPRRVVAVKVMKQGIVSRSALRRFEYESQILARLRHPGIGDLATISASASLPMDPVWRWTQSVNGPSLAMDLVSRRTS